MKLGIVMPVVLQHEALLKVTLEAVAHLTTRHNGTLYIICNRIGACTLADLKTQLTMRFMGKVVVVYEDGVERSVAASWNKGCELAICDAADYLAIVGNDTRLDKDCLDTLLDYGERNEAHLCSGWGNQRRMPISPDEISDGAAFSCLVCRANIWQKHGLFDTNFRPAYFEDNDYYARVILGGGSSHVLAAARFFHHGSMTARADSRVGARVRARFQKNRAYFAKKWGVPKPKDVQEAVLQTYYRHPFNDPTKPLSWFPEVPEESNTERIP